MAERTLGHFLMLEKLGAGGMGEVYKARDTRLNRLVAIKVLTVGHVDDNRKRRFLQEAQTASALHHPNIVVVHDIDVDNGTDYIVMEYIAGRTLDSVIPKNGMSMAEGLRVAIQVAAGLAAAHAAGIVHRDIKPSNLMVSDDGHVKILDFGIAKLTDTEPLHGEDVTLTLRASTEPGMIVGTTSYMSPEQAEGRTVDARSDIFSFGAVLFEMLTGRRAFRGATPAATLAAILREEPSLPNNVPPELQRVMRPVLAQGPGTTVPAHGRCESSD